MWNVIADVASVAATATVGLVAGIFLGFAVAVMPGLRRVDDDAFTSTMRGINEAILNPLFLGCFIGALPIGAIAIAGRWTDPSGALPWTIAGVVGHLAVVVITMAANVPLNDRLRDATGDAASARVDFEVPWNRWHVARTVVGVLAMVSLCVALLVHR